MSVNESKLAARYRRVPGHGNLVAKPDGTIWRHSRGVWRRANLHGDRHGYSVVKVRESGQNRNLLVHTAILSAFVGPRPSGGVCRHLDGNRSNNRLENLCWGTVRENYADAVCHGTAMVGSLQSQSKLTEDEVREIRRRAKSGPYGVQQELAREFGVSHTVISHVVSGKAWCHVS